MKKHFLFAALAAVLAFSASGCASGEPADNSTQADTPPTLTDVTVNTTVRDIGQYPENFVLTFDKEIPIVDIVASNFSMSGTAGMWGSNDKRDFTCAFDDAKIEGNTLTLFPKDFPEKFFYVEKFAVNCEIAPEFNFTDKDVTRVATAVADEFEKLTHEGDVSFDYRLFTPAESEKKPLVIVFHGYGDTNNLLTYKTATIWAEPENQAVRPCYVLAPVIEDGPYFQASSRDKIYDAVKEIVDSMIGDGRVDKNRIYVMGNSFGGLATIELCEKYPEYVAGALALCPALTYAPNAVLNLDKMAEVPIWFAHATNDKTIPVTASQNAVNSLAGVEVLFTEYSDDNMEAVGADIDPNSTYSFHHVELAVFNDDSYMTWLFEKHK